MFNFLRIKIRIDDKKEEIDNLTNSFVGNCLEEMAA